MTEGELEALRGVFALFDADGTGSIDATEFAALLEKVGRDPAEGAFSGSGTGHLPARTAAWAALPHYTVRPPPECCQPYGRCCAQSCCALPPWVRLRCLFAVAVARTPSVRACVSECVCVCATLRARVFNADVRCPCPPCCLLLWPCQRRRCC
jgi:hypothetical protein